MLSPAPCLPICACRYPTVHGGAGTPSAALTTEHRGVLMGPDQEDLSLPEGESEAGTGRRLEVRCGGSSLYGKGRRARVEVRGGNKNE